jgi:SAM-dependent methyltransferase
MDSFSSTFHSLTRRQQTSTLVRFSGGPVIPVRILSDTGHSVAPPKRVLDFGCGAGTTVALLLAEGYDAHGCDLAFKQGPHTARLQQDGRIRRIEAGEYRIPFEDASFDVILSNNVLEHVRNTDEVLRELARVLKPGGVSLHFAPSKFRPIEGHVKIPLASVYRARWWLAFWMSLGVGTKVPGAGALAAADRHIAYLDSSTRYLSPSELRRAFMCHFSRVDFAERSNFSHSTSRRMRAIAPILRVLPCAGLAYRYFHTYVLVAGR